MNLTRRENWEHYIRANVGRYLYGGAAGSWMSSGAGFSPEPIAHFLERLRQADVHFLAHVYFLLQPKVQEFFGAELRELLRSLTGTVTRERELSRRGIRGKPLWSDTLRARAAGRADTASYAVVRTEKTADVPENRLLKTFLSRARDTAMRAAELVGTQTLVEPIDSVRRAAELGLKHPYLRDVEDTGRSSATMRSRARRHRNKTYGNVADMEELLDRAMRLGKWEAILALLRGGWYAPLSEDDLFELYVLLRVLHAVEAELGFGPPTSLNLLSRGAGDAARFARKDGCVARVLFDRAPTEMLLATSRYEEVLRDYEGLSPAPHRPDVCVEFARPPNEPVRLLIEVKRTDDDKYKRDSVYKVFGYVYDFESLWPIRSQMPKAILVLPDDVRTVGADPVPQRDVVVVGGASDHVLAKALGRALEALSGSPGRA